jgi:hypothetical protein
VPVSRQSKFWLTVDGSCSAMTLGRHLMIFSIGRLFSGHA